MVHIINKSALQNHSLQTCLTVIDTNDVILFIEDGVINVTIKPNHQTIENLFNQGKIYVLKEDLQARGLMHKVNQYANIINYDGFVDLVILHQKNLSW